MRGLIAALVLAAAPMTGAAQSSFGTILENGDSSFNNSVEDQSQWLEQERKDDKTRAAQARRNLNAAPDYPDFYNACLGMTQYPTNCYNVKDPDMKSLCLANSGQGYQTECYNIRNPDLKNLCLANAYPDYKTMCYNIGNGTIENTCLAASNRSYNAMCYNVKSEPWRSFCAGIALNANNCYNLN